MTKLTENSTDNELVITRVFNAPRELVYKVWTDPKHVANWWGPKVFTNPVCDIDLRVGGAFHFVMRSPMGDEFPMHGKYLKIIKNERIVYTDDLYKQADMWKMMIGDKVSDDVDFNTIHNVVTVVFEDEGDKTKVTLTTTFVSAEVKDAMIKMQMVEGWTESLEKLEIELKNI
jgi:uncharacterized protein YndB with AHSA1/START domain